jgi:hypothetical protein
MENQREEFAEEYTFRERVRLVAICALIGGAFVLVGKLWLLPAFSEFVATAECRSVFGVSAMAVVWYGLFVGFPLLIALSFGCTFGWHGYRILRDGQSPPIGVKVVRRTRITRGFASRISGYLYLLAFAPPLALAGWGYFAAASLSHEAAQWQLAHPKCAAN